jgi:Tfp pilus assembly protein PilF
MTMKKITILTAAALLAVSCTTTKETVKEDKPVVEAKPKVKSLAALIGDGFRFLDKDDPEKAKSEFERALQKEPNSFDARLGMALVDVKLGKFDEARGALETLSAEKSDDRRVLMALGKLYEGSGDFKKGIKLFKAELKKDAFDTDVLNGLMVLYRLNGDYKEAERTCTKILSRDPGNAAALKNLSLIYYDQKKFALSETIAINSLKKDDKDAALYNNRGMIRVQRGRYVEAMPFFRKAVEINPNLLSAHLNIGAIALRYRDYETAEKHFGQAVKLSPRHAEGNLGYALALSGMQKGQDALAQLTRALEIKESCTAQSETARVYKFQLNKLQPALEWANKYVKCKGGKLDDKDPMKIEIENIKNELEMQKMQAESEAGGGEG